MLCSTRDVHFTLLGPKELYQRFFEFLNQVNLVKVITWQMLFFIVFLKLELVIYVLSL